MPMHHALIVPGSERAVRVRTGVSLIEGDLVVPTGAHGVVLFAHGSGSSRSSRRNRWVAAELQHAGFATLLIDLLTPAEEAEDAGTGAHRFDIAMLGERLVDAADWLAHEPETRALPLGLFGASAGAAAALVAAAARPGHVRAVVSRGGRPDLAGAALRLVRAPTLLIVGGDDRDVLRLNRQAQAELPCPTELHVVPGASHLFEEPGMLEIVSTLARDWFSTHLRRSPLESNAATGW